ncbi:MsnO8 family LLM class oxidoreductase [Couchioplanes azureus]|uniref:MsnO8 family LLM class oxidoreductase n=1 Tax=Couchioplanes caeruleus TaxID=56438 RepID=UPI0016703A53|nr:MsnO8 family LLM class oxidoreductase [Couchioplanes caeruleus]GGQ81535.1 alkane 1-monooxygenase [Couchioplanes caeruleus subsp. azureus]
MSLPPLSILEVAPAERGRTASEALAATATAVRAADELGLRRAWFAEHHGAPLIGSVAPPVLIAHAAATTSRLRVGSGGVLLPNHAPRAVAEQFATLDALHPGRIDLGIGRGPGTFDASVVAALRRGAPPATADDYRAGIVELLGYLSGDGGPALLPGYRAAVQPWLLSSSTAGASLAGELGLPVAFAHHIRPQNTAEALDRYREAFRPSRWLDRPYVMIAVETVCADTDAEADALGRPLDLVKADLFAGRADRPLLPPAEAAEVTLPAEVQERLRDYRAQQAHGSPATVAARLAALAAATGADEIMLSTTVYDAAARRRSLELVAKTTA